MVDALIQFANRLRGYPTWDVVIELVLIWLVVWWVFRFLKGTRGARLLKGFGLVVVLAAAIVAVLGGEGAAHFARLRYLLGSFLTFATLALIVVFQPELRRALVRLGEARLFRGPAPQSQGVIEEIARGVEYLAKHKIGAIIAIERSVGLEGIIEAGTKINGRVSSELIKTIFWPGSALHDMGVIVRGNEVAAAGVQFPLADGEDISQELGSRHRAAIGLSQEADCLVIVVSEETGAISLAERGQLVRKLSIDGLRAMLIRGLTQQTATTPKSRASRAPRTATPPAPKADDKTDEEPPAIERAA